MTDAMTSFAPMPCPKCKILTTWFFDGLCWECARAKRPVVGDELNDKLIECLQIQARAIQNVIRVVGIRNNVVQLHDEFNAMIAIDSELEELKEKRRPRT